MRISIPTITFNPLLPSSPAISKAAAVENLVTFLAPGNVAVVTGAGVSVDSGIRAYRGKYGRYLNPNYKPIFYHELVDPSPKGITFRQRYWARSYLGWPAVRVAQPNPSHFAISALQHQNIVKHIITQNVDGLHVKASPPSWGSIERDRRILELHGRLRTVSCAHGHTYSRSSFQDTIAALNPAWKDYADEMARTNSEPRTNPDGDVELRGKSVSDFVLPECHQCIEQGLGAGEASVLKPDVIFFGESIKATIKERSMKTIEDCDRVLFIGTTLATYSAFRLLKHAVDLGKPTLMLNVGPTRGDEVPGLQKIEWKSGDVLGDACHLLFGKEVGRNSELRTLLSSGVVCPPDDYLEDALPTE